MLGEKKNTFEPLPQTLTPVAPAFQREVGGWGGGTRRLAVGLRSDDDFVMEQIKLCEILDAFPPCPGGSQSI